MNYIGFIYEWKNRVNGKKYLGSHKGTVNDGYVGSGLSFIMAIKKYGIDAFERRIVEYSDSYDRLREREQYYLDLFECASSIEYYNISYSATGGNMGQDYSTSSKKASDTMKQNGTYARNSERMKQNNPSKNGVWNKGLTGIRTRQTPIQNWEKKAHSERMKKHNPNAGGKCRMKPTQVSNGIETFKFDNLKAAEKFMREHTGEIINHSSVSLYMKKNKPYKGYYWNWF